MSTCDQALAPDTRLEHPNNSTSFRQAFIVQFESQNDIILPNSTHKHEMYSSLKMQKQRHLKISKTMLHSAR